MKKRSSILTFITAWCPGAGQMYLGYMKRGLSLLLISALIIIVALLSGLEEIALLLLVVWVYSFFDTFNLARQAYEQQVPEKDSFIFDIDKSFTKDWNTFLSKRHKWIAFILIFIGCSSLYNGFISQFLWQFYNTYNIPILASILSNFPTLVIAIVLIVVGISMLKNTNKSKSNDDVVEYKAGK